MTFQDSISCFLVFLSKQRKMQCGADRALNQLQFLPTGFFFLIGCCSLLATRDLPASCSFPVCIPSVDFTTFFSVGQKRCQPQTVISKRSFKKLHHFLLQIKSIKTAVFVDRGKFNQSRVELHLLLKFLLHFFRYVATKLCRALSVEGLSFSKSTSISS